MVYVPFMANSALAAEINKIRADVAAIRAAFLVLTAKLDADTVSGMDDDYASLTNPAALTSAAITTTEI